MCVAVGVAVGGGGGDSLWAGAVSSMKDEGGAKERMPPSSFLFLHLLLAPTAEPGWNTGNGGCAMKSSEISLLGSQHDGQQAWEGHGQHPSVL